MSFQVDTSPRPNNQCIRGMGALLSVSGIDVFQWNCEQHGLNVVEMVRNLLATTRKVLLRENDRSFDGNRTFKQIKPRR